MERKKPTKRLLLGIIALLAVSGVGFAGYIEEKAPFLIGLTADSARVFIAENLGCDPDSVPLFVRPDSFYTDSLTTGIIIWQDPEPDSAIGYKITVRLTAPMTIELPDVRGMPGFDASAYLQSLGLQFLPVSKTESKEYPAGTVMKTVPAPGDTVQRGESVGATVSEGVIISKPVYTSTGVPINLYETPSAKITSISTSPVDSSTFKLAFSIQITNPYKHSMGAENFSCILKVNGAILKKEKPEVSAIKIGPKGIAKGKLEFLLAYPDISPALAEILLGKGRYRLVGTYALTVESGYSTKPLDTGEFEYDLASASSEVKTKLEEIMIPEETEPEIKTDETNGG
ncbi:PASTA domain-containing protein [candidate division WOR-3 bacterium]|nr:PASTA domain-containing protein [candidate division WOR-3 bacterium]